MSRVQVLSRLKRELERLPRQSQGEARISVGLRPKANRIISCRGLNRIWNCSSLARIGPCEPQQWLPSSSVGFRFLISCLRAENRGLQEEFEVRLNVAQRSSSSVLVMV